MKNTRQNSASIKKKVTNVLVHLFLTILSVIWVFPIFWVVLLSFREQKGQYITSFWPKKFTMANYVKLFTDTALFNFPEVVFEYAVCSNLFLYPDNILCFGDFLLSVQTPV